MGTAASCPIRFHPGFLRHLPSRRAAGNARLNRGRELLARFNCGGCHHLQGIDRPAMLGPDLTDIGTKVSRQWIYKWLKEPRTITDSDGNVRSMAM